MASDISSIFSCGDCSKAFTKRMHYNRHRKNHDRPYSCSLCEQAFSLKTGLERHRSTHRGTIVKFKCRIPGCKFSGTTRKDYLWKHMQKAHRGLHTDKGLRALYNEAVIIETISNTDEQNLQLLEASRQGDKEKVKLLISQNASIATADSYGRTALHLACEIGNTSMAELLLGKGADIEAKSNLGHTAFVLAASAGHFPVVKLLLENGANEYKFDLWSLTTGWGKPTRTCPGC